MGSFPTSRSRGASLRALRKLDKEWTVQQVPLRERYLAISALYAGANLNLMGSEAVRGDGRRGAAADPGPDADLGRGVAHQGHRPHKETRDFAMPHGISTSARNMAYGLRAQTRWMKGDLTGAAADAALVPQGFRAFVIREATPDRRNRPYYAGTVTQVR